MYYYFTAKFSAVLKIDGVYHGQIEQCARRIEIVKPDAFVEVCPLNREQFPFSFILNQKFLFSPPSGVSLVDLKGGYLIEFNFLQDNSPFEVLAQEKFSHAVCTVFKENGLKVSIETPNDFFAETISFCCKSATITPFTLANKQLLAVCFLGEEKIVNCYLLENKTQKVFLRQVSEFSVENGFKTTEEFLDIAKHKLTCSWNLQNNLMVKGDISLCASEKFCVDNLPKHLIAYAFLEELCLGGDIAEYLAENIKKNQSYLADYFGEFLGIMPTPDFRRFDEIGLIYRYGQNKYRVEYFCFELQDRKICNIVKSN